MKNKASGGSQPRKLEGASHLARRGKNAEAFLNIVSHSPILLSLPGGEILSFDDGKIHPCKYEETDSYQVISLFINDRERILKRLLEEG